MATAEQIVGELIEDRTERVGPEPADVMGPLKERLEHGCTPGKVLKSRGEHPDYAEPCLPVAGMETGESVEERPARMVRLRIILWVGIIPFMRISA